LPDSKTGEKLVPLGAPALAVIAALPRVGGNPYLLPGGKKDMHLSGCRRPGSASGRGLALTT
jgi:hypothetical protein